MANLTARPITHVGQCRTFGELAEWKAYRTPGLCAFCHKDKQSTFRYSTRHSICNDCVEPRKDVVLPRVKRREKFHQMMAKAASNG